jgi:hypothetical protein
VWHSSVRAAAVFADLGFVALEREGGGGGMV